MPVTYEEICGFLEQRDVAFARHEDGEILIQQHTENYRNPAGAPHAIVVVKIENDGTFLKVFIPQAFSYKDGPYKAVVLQAALFVNYISKMLQFEYDPRDGEVRAMVEFPIADSSLTEDQFFMAFGGLCALVDEYAPFMQQAMHGRLDAATSGIDREAFGEFMRMLRTEAGDDSGLIDDPEVLEHKMLKANGMYERFMRRHEFKPGQLVCWKAELKNRKYPAYGECGVVVSVLPVPVMDATANSGSPYFREPLDIVLGFVDGDGDFVTYHFDSRRFAPVAERPKGPQPASAG